MALRQEYEAGKDGLRAELCFRFSMVSKVLTKTEVEGVTLKDAVAELARTAHVAPTGLRLVSSRTIYRWLERYAAEALIGLAPAPRSTTPTERLPEGFVEFLVKEKKDEPGASIPEVIRRAVEAGIVPDVGSVDRTTAYRVAVRLGLPVQRGHRQQDEVDDKRRFAHAHRMQVVLADFTHFRVGPDRLRRAALIFLDDSTRFALGGVVDTSERCEVYLRALFDVIATYGLMRVMYFDHGSAFDALDTQAVLAALDVRIAQGPSGYKEGRGKIERANRTFKADLLGRWSGVAGAPTACTALTLALNHYLSQVYNHRHHDALKAGGEKRTPHQTFHDDTRPFALPKSREALLAKFVVHFDRRVSADHVISLDGVAYEVPAGYAGSRVRVRRHVLTSELWMDHEGRSLQLHRLDPTANAHAHRASSPKPDEVERPLPRSAAQRRFDRDMSPLVDAEGGFAAPDDDDADGAGMLEVIR